MASAMELEFIVAGLIGSRESIKDAVESGDLNNVGWTSASLAWGSLVSHAIGFEFAEAGLVGSSE
jgi:hypothetical protein